MSSFTTPLRVTPVENSDRLWELLSEFEYEIGAKGSRKRVICPVGFQTDFASIPRIFWGIIPPWGKYGKAAVVHDFLCVNRFYLDENDQRVFVTRAECDAIFLEAMTVLDVPYFQRHAMFLAVRTYAIVKRIK